jgi:hypothetical protein
MLVETVTRHSVFKITAPYCPVSVIQNLLISTPEKQLLALNLHFQVIENEKGDVSVI